MSTGPSQDPTPLRDDDGLLEPFDWYREMRADAPVRFDPERACWDVFRYDDVKTVFADPGTFSSDPTRVGDGGDDGGSPMTDTPISTDPPEHDRLRSAVEAAFRPGAVADLEPRIRGLAVDLVESFGPDGECDFVADFAEPLPVLVVAELLGVPPADRGRFADWSETVVEVHHRPSGLDADDRDVNETMEELTAYFGDALARRRENPRDDLLTLVAGGGDGPPLEVREMLGFCMLMMLGGTITVGTLLGNVLRCLADRPDLLAACEAGDCDLAGVVEETLRYRSPLQALARYAVEPTTLGGHDVAPGETVVCWLGSANRDTRRFDDPGAFRPGRSSNPHLALGHGPHFCLGAHLARLEARVALEAFFERASGVDVDARDRTPVRSDTISLHGVESLPVDFDWSP